MTITPKRMVNRFETALTRYIEVHADVYADAEDRGDAKRALIEAREALLTAFTSTYAEGRTDESKAMAGPLALMRDAFDLLESHLGDSDVHYDDDEEEREYAPIQVAARFLMAAIQAMQPSPEPAMREETIYEKSARWNWPDGRPDL